MRGARRLGGAVVTIALLVAALWTCADGASGPREGAVGSSAGSAGRPSVRGGGPRLAEVPATDGPGRRTDRRTAVRVGAADGAAGEEIARAEPEPTAVTGRIVRGGEDDVVPLAGVTVRLLRGADGEVGEFAWLEPRSTALPDVSAESVTGPDGRFAFPVPGATPWTVVVIPPDGSVEARAAEAWTGEGPTDLGDLFLGERRPVALVVEDEDGRPLPAAEARVFFEGVRPALRVAADATGRIVLDAPRSVLVTAPGREFVFLRRFDDAERVRLGPALPVAGRVVDDAGTPLEGIDLVLDGSARLHARSGEGGAFRFEGASARCGPEGVNVWVRVGEGRWELAQVMPGDEDARIVVPRGCRIEGVVVFEDGRTVAGATVGNERTDAEGRFLCSLGEVREEPIELSAWARTRVTGASAIVRTHAGSERVVVRPGETVADVRIVLHESPYSFFRLDVRGEDDRPVRAGAWAQAPWFEAGSCDGKTPFEAGVPPGTTLRLVVNVTDATVSRTEVDVVTTADISSEPVVVRLAGPRACAIRVVDAAGNPLPAGDVKVRIDANRGIAVAPDGRVVAAAGTGVSVVVVARGLRYEGTITIPPPPRDFVEIRIPATGTVRGRFVHADGRAAAGIGVSIQGSAPGIAPVGSDPTRADGVFVLSPVPAGRASFFAWRDEEGSPEAAARSIEVPADGDLDLGDVVVWDDVRLEGRVLGADGTGVGGASVTVTWNAGRGSASVASGPGGRFSLRVPGARDAVAVASRGDGAACVELLDLSAARTATLRLRPTGSIEVRVPPSWGETGWDLTLEPASGGFAWEPESSCEDFTTTLSRVPAGRWTVVARAGEDVQRREVVVAAGGAAVVEIGP